MEYEASDKKSLENKEGVIAGFGIAIALILTAIAVYFALSGERTIALRAVIDFKNIDAFSNWSKWYSIFYIALGVVFLAGSVAFTAAHSISVDGVDYEESDMRDHYLLIGKILAAIAVIGLICFYIVFFRQTVSVWEGLWRLALIVLTSAVPATIASVWANQES